MRGAGLGIDVGVDSDAAATAAPVPTGVATGIGSLPGEDIDRALAFVVEAVPDLPYLPQLPARGPGSDLVGRTATQLRGLAVDLQPAGWRLTGHAGLDQRRGLDRMTADLDALMPVAGPGYDGRLTVSLAGPWTLAATLSLPRGGPVLGDAGAVRDLTDSLAETVSAHLDDVRARVPQASLVLQLDEPALPAALAGRIPTESGLGRLSALEPATALDRLRDVVTAGHDGRVPVVVHCCGSPVPLALLRDAGADAVSLDLLRRDGLDLDAVGETVEAGLRLWLGVVPGLGPGVPPNARQVLEPVRRLWSELGFDPDTLPASVALTPTCGLVGASPGWMVTSHRVLRQAAAVLAEAPEGTSLPGTPR